MRSLGHLFELPIDPKIMDRARALEIPFGPSGVDPYGVSLSHIAKGMTFLQFFYRHYFKVRVHGIEHVPARGRAMLIGNHSGGFALDAGMVIASMFLEKDPPRLAQGMIEKFLSNLPIVSPWMTRVGQLTGLPQNAVRLLEDGRLLMVFPEGAKGTAKLYRERYTLVHFGSGFMRLALRTKTPIVPLAFLGGGEAVPSISNSETLGRLLGVPYVPITPWGVAWPLPVQLDVYYSEPMLFEGDGNEEDELVAGYVEKVRSRIASLIERGRQERTRSL